jgi:hypothetical protein
MVLSLFFFFSNTAFVSRQSTCDLPVICRNARWFTKEDQVQREFMLSRVSMEAVSVFETAMPFYGCDLSDEVLLESATKTPNI